MSYRPALEYMRFGLNKKSKRGKHEYVAEWVAQACYPSTRKAGAEELLVCGESELGYTSTSWPA